MMAPRRIVIVLAAEKMLAPKKKRGAAEPRTTRRARDVEPLIDYFGSPSPDDVADSSCSRLPTKRPTRFRWRRTCASPRRWRRRDASSPAAASTAARTRRAGWSGACEGRRARDRSAGRGEAPRARRRRSGAACARTSRSCCCLRRARDGSCSTTSRPSPARPCITATTGRWSARSSSRKRGRGASRAAGVADNGGVARS